MTITNLEYEICIIDKMEEIGLDFLNKSYDFDKKERILNFQEEITKLKVEVRMSLK